MTQLTFPCSVNSIPFYPEISNKTPLDSIENYGQSSYLNSLTKWQSKLQYVNKRLFTDTITLQFKTQKNSELALNSPSTGRFSYSKLSKFYVCGSKIGSDGFQLPGDIISSFTNNLNPLESSGNYPMLDGSNFWGIQTAIYDIYVDPITLNQTPLSTYMWQFRFVDVLNASTDSGVYFLRFDNYLPDGTFITYYSEPILVYGNDAGVYFPETLRIQSSNLSNKNDIIINGWFNNSMLAVVFNTRIEANILEYSQKGIYLGFLNQNYLAQNTYNKSWKTWNFLVGYSHSTAGIPIVQFEIIVKMMEMDIIKINNQYYTYDTQSGGSDTTAAIWKIEQGRVHGLVRGMLPIRFKYENQQFLSAPIALQRVMDGTGDSTFG